MKWRIWVSCCGFLLAALAAVGPLVQGQQQTTESGRRYIVTDLGTLGGTFSAAGGINNRAWIVGGATLPDGNTHAFLWRDGVMSDLHTLGGPNSVAAYPLSEIGQIGGFAEASASDPLGEDFCGFHTNLICLPFLWQDGRLNPLPTLGGNNGEAFEVNNRGQVAGLAENTTLDPTCQAPQVRQFKPVIWERNQIRELSTAQGDPDGVAFAINDNGDAAGASGDCSTFIGFAGLAQYSHALLWRQGKVTDLGNLGGTTNNVPGDINNEAHVVGSSNLPGDATFHAFLWTQGRGMTDLGTLPGDIASIAFSIGESDQIVGQSCDAEFNCRAFLWENGVMTDFNEIIPSDSNLYLIVAESINSDGQAVGIALEKRTGEMHAFLATLECTPLSPPFGSGAASKFTLPDGVRNLLREQLTKRGLGRKPRN